MNGSKILKMNVIMNDKTIQRNPVIVPKNIVDENKINQYDKIIDLYAIINDTIMTMPVIYPKDFIDIYCIDKKNKLIETESHDREVKKVKFTVETKEINNEALVRHIPTISPEDSIIKYINNIFNNLDVLYLVFNENEHQDFINYFNQLFENNTNALLDKINCINSKIIDFNISLNWHDKNPDFYFYIVQYPIKIDDERNIVYRIKYKTRQLIYFCEKIIKWTNYCLKHKINMNEQINFLNIDLDIYRIFFNIDQNAINYWNNYRLNVPMYYVYQKLNKDIEIVYSNKSYIYIKQN